MERTKKLLGHKVISILRKLSELGNPVGPAHRKYVEAHEVSTGSKGPEEAGGKGDLLLSWRRVVQFINTPCLQG